MAQQANKALRKMPEKYIRCRRAHKWDQKGLSKGPGNTIMETFECERCGTVRYKYFDSMGRIEGGEYDYPDDYLNTDGERIVQQDVRREGMRRWVRA